MYFFKVVTVAIGAVLVHGNSVELSAKIPECGTKHLIINNRQAFKHSNIQKLK